jgi:hypothetical protein
MMIGKNRNRLLVVIGLVLLIVAAAAAKPRKPQRVLTGSWGAPHIRLTVDRNSATIDYDCANGAIAGPLTIDSKGRFSWLGTHNPEHGGPIRIDEPSNNHKAIYTGAVKGDTMTLTVRLAATKELVDTFTLKRGGAGRVFKCK